MFLKIIHQIKHNREDLLVHALGQPVGDARERTVIGRLRSDGLSPHRQADEKVTSVKESGACVNSPNPTYQPRHGTGAGPGHDNWT